MRPWLFVLGTLLGAATAAAPPPAEAQRLTASNGVKVTVSDLNPHEKEIRSPRVKMVPRAGAEGWATAAVVASNRGQLFERRVYAHIEYPGEHRSYHLALFRGGDRATLTFSLAPGDSLTCKKIRTNAGEKCSEEMRVDLARGDVAKYAAGDKLMLSFLGKDGSGHIIHVEIPVSHFNAVEEVGRRGFER